MSRIRLLEAVRVGKANKKSVTVLVRQIDKAKEREGKNSRRVHIKRKRIRCSTFGCFRVIVCTDCAFLIGSRACTLPSVLCDLFQSSINISTQFPYSSVFLSCFRDFCVAYSEWDILFEHSIYLDERIVGSRLKTLHECPNR